jgi:hypothetical protein
MHSDRQLNRFAAYALLVMVGLFGFPAPAEIVLDSMTWQVCMSISCDGRPRNHGPSCRMS